MRNEGRAAHTPRIFISDLEVGLVEEGEVSRKFQTLREHIVSGDSSWCSRQGFIPRVINCLVNPCFGHQLSLPVTRFASRVRYTEHLFLMMASIDLRINPPDHQTDFIRCCSLLQATGPHYLPWKVLTPSRAASPSPGGPAHSLQMQTLTLQPWEFDRGPKSAPLFMP